MMIQDCHEDIGQALHSESTAERPSIEVEEQSSLLLLAGTSKKNSTPRAAERAGCQDYATFREAKSSKQRDSLVLGPHVTQSSRCMLASSISSKQCNPETTLIKVQSLQNWDHLGSTMSAVKEPLTCCGAPERRLPQLPARDPPQMTHRWWWTLGAARESTWG